MFSGNSNIYLIPKVHKLLAIQNRYNLPVCHQRLLQYNLSKKEKLQNKIYCIFKDGFEINNILKNYLERYKDAFVLDLLLAVGIYKRKKLVIMVSQFFSCSFACFHSFFLKIFYNKFPPTTA